MSDPCPTLTVHRELPDALLVLVRSVGCAPACCQSQLKTTAQAVHDLLVERGVFASHGIAAVAMVLHVLLTTSATPEASETEELLQ